MIPGQVFSDGVETQADLLLKAESGVWQQISLGQVNFGPGAAAGQVWGIRCGIFIGTGHSVFFSVGMNKKVVNLSGWSKFSGWYRESIWPGDS